MYKRLTTALASALLLISLAAAQSTLLPVVHPVYGFLDRMETLGLLDHPLLGSKPVGRVRIAQLLDEILEKVTEQPGVLSAVDVRSLQAYRWEFHRDLDREGITSPVAPHPEERARLGCFSDWMSEKSLFTGVFYRDGQHFYSYENPNFDAYLDPRGSAQVITQQGDSRSIIITSAGFRLRGQIPKTIGLYLDFHDMTERGRGPYWSRSQLYQDRFGFVFSPKGASSINYDVADIDVAIGGKFWELHAGKMQLRWGPGRSGQLLLSDWGTSFHQVQAAVNLGQRMRFVYVFGSLSNYTEIDDTLYTSAGFYRTIEAAKYLAAHRLEWNPHRRLRFAFSESVIFGERSPELAYLIPINFFYSAQHDLGDEDNTLMCFDAVWIPHARWKLYGQFLIDDITFGRVTTDYYGNKIGWLAGLSYVQPLGFKNWEVALEMVKLRPFVYTHHYPVNVYTHWIAPLGYRYPPNSEVGYGEIEFRPHRRVLLQASYTRLLHGANIDQINAGGSLFAPHEKDGAENAPFLGGSLQKTSAVQLLGTVELLENLFLWSRGAWTESNLADDSWEWEVGFKLN
ncbi:MAG: hypothetical protein NTW14_11450 [bacterium]|nr:hypothetical protein [bacterium]